MIRTNQGGSVGSFIVVAVLLVLVTAGLLYYVKRSDEPKSVTPVAVSTNEDKQPAAGAGQKVDEDTNSTSEGDNATPSRTAQSNQSSTTVTELSKTGPAETFAQIIMVGTLAAMMVAYMQSRRPAIADRSSL